MKSRDRKFIFEGRVGSKLYGTSLPTSDDDFRGVFLPSTADLLGMQNCPTELSMNTKVSEGDRNSVGDVDRKFYSLQKFLKHAADGQPWALEMLYIPPNNVVSDSVEWSWIIKDALPLILSRKGVAGFVGFALAQSYKATVKGENLNLIRDLLANISQLNVALNEQIRDVSVDMGDTALIAGCKVSKTFAEDGTPVLEIAGRKFNFGLKVNKFVNSLEIMQGRYGTRSAASAENGQDFKSLYHAYRLIYEAKEFLSTGHITLPRPEASFLLEIRQGLYEADYQAELTAHIDDIRQNIEPNSPLPLLPKWDKLNEFCNEVLLEHLR